MININKTLKNIISLIINIIVVSILTYCLIIFSSRNGISPRGTSYYIFYTTDSNLAYAIICLITIPFNILNIIKKDIKLPRWLTITRFFGTTVSAVTFFVVLLLLGPFNPKGFLELYTDTNIFLHLIVPLLAMINFIFFDSYVELEFKLLLFNTIPSLSYGFFYILWVFAFKQKDVYTFFKHGVWAAIGIYLGIFLLCFGIGAGLKYLNKLTNTYKKKRD